jgi:hypothetical protein
MQIWIEVDPTEISKFKGLSAISHAMSKVLADHGGSEVVARYWAELAILLDVHVGKIEAAIFLTQATKNPPPLK